MDSKDAAKAARPFVADYLGPIGDLAIAPTLDVLPNRCSIHITSGNLDGEVDFVASDDSRVVPSGFTLGGDVGLSLRVQRRHITATYASDCTDCATFEMTTRYGSATAHVAPQPATTMEADLSADPSVEGAYVFIARAADGRISHALGTQVRPGDFAAS